MGSLTYVVQSSVNANNPSLPDFVVDPVLDGAGGGVLALFDASYGPSYPGGTYPNIPLPGNPVTSQLIYDFSGSGNNGTIVIQAADATKMVYANNGFLFTGCTTKPDDIELPAAVNANLWSTVTGPAGSMTQRWFFCMWIKTPTLANWVTSTTAAEICGSDFTQWIPWDLGFAGLGVNANPSFNLLRKTPGSHVGCLVTLNAADRGGVVQICGWRKDDGTMVHQIHGVNSGLVITNTETTTGDCDVNFSSLVLRFGLTNGWSTTNNQANQGFQLYRGYVINRALDRRDPVATSAADYTNCIAKGLWT